LSTGGNVVNETKEAPLTQSPSDPQNMSSKSTSRAVDLSMSSPKEEQENSSEQSIVEELNSDTENGSKITKQMSSSTGAKSSISETGSKNTTVEKERDEGVIIKSQYPTDDDPIGGLAATVSVSKDGTVAIEGINLPNGSKAEPSGQVTLPKSSEVVQNPDGTISVDGKKLPLGYTVQVTTDGSITLITKDESASSENSNTNSNILPNEQTRQPGLPPNNLANTEDTKNQLKSQKSPSASLPQSNRYLGKQAGLVNYELFSAL